MNIEDWVSSLDLAIQATVHDFVDPSSRRRGAAGLAPLVGMKPGTLSNKSNPEQEHQLGLAESIPLQLVAQDFQILYAYTHLLGHAAYKLPAHDADASDLALLNLYCEMHARVGALAKQIRNSLEDGRITAAELPPLRAAFDELVRAGLGVITRIEALAR